VVPVENSTEGVVTRSLDLFLHTPLFIIGETSLFVRHNLLRKTDSLAGIDGGRGAPAGAGAVPRLAVGHLPQAERRPGVQQRRRRPAGRAGRAALAGIASTRAGSEFGLHVVAPAVQDDAHNRTRFAIVTHPQRHPAPKPSGHDCTSLVVGHQPPGAVHDMLVPLKKHGVSMTRFESRPARSGQWEYYFYIDIEGHPDEPTWPPR
jgi:chorismate mutase/prephenate dehydratase